MTPEERELVARFEASLRGKLVHGGPSGSVCLFTPDDMYSHSHATDPSTPDGREWWAEALKMDVVRFFNIYGDIIRWEASPWMYPEQAHKDRAEAIIAAVIQAARQWEKSQ